MAFSSSWFLPLLLLSALVNGITASDLPTLDEPFQNSFHSLTEAPCVSLFHRNGRIGCGTLSRDNMKGTLMHWSTLAATLVSNNDDGNNNGGSSSIYLPPYVAVVYDYEYTSDNVEQMLAVSQNNALQGILVVNSTSTTEDESNGDDNSNGINYKNSAPPMPRGENTPSYQLNPSYQYEWNPNGDALMLKDMYGIPAGYIQDVQVGAYLLSESTEKAEEYIKAKDFTNPDSLDENPGIVAEINLYMGPNGMTTQKCLSWLDDEDGRWRPKCLPLGGNSVWALAGSPYEKNENGGNGDAEQRELENDGDDGANANANDDDNGKKPIIMLATNLDSTSMFHDLVPGANTAASNILALLMAAKLLGSSVTDATLDNLNKKIMFAFFQGEMYGFMGSRSFLKDVAGFQCDDGLEVPANKKQYDNGKSNKMACLNPLRHDLDFTDLGNIESMIAVDQIGGTLTTENTFYVHGGGGDYYNSLTNIATGMSSDDWTISQGSVNYIPPTPLSSLVQITGGASGGIVLTGYDDTFSDEHYLSHLDSDQTRNINLEAVAMAATVLARTALAAAYDDGNGNNDDVLSYAEGVIPQLEADDESLVELANCLLTDGNCDLLMKYGQMERVNSRSETGTDLGLGQALGKPPNYYVGVYDANNGQAFVEVKNKGRYGAYTNEFDEDKDDITFLIRPTLLEMSVHGLLDEYLGQGSASSNGDDEVKTKKCSSSGDCSSISYCSASGDVATCSGEKVCVCSRARYHFAVDEALMPSPNNATGVFVVSDDDEGVSPMYTEPYWSNEIGKEIYRQAGTSSGYWTLGFGLASGAGWVAATMFLKKRLVKEKLY